MVYATLGEVESKSIRFTAKSRTVVVNVTPKSEKELIISFYEVK
jgi:hypothetical protein